MKGGKQSDAAAPWLVSSRKMLALDHFRVPYEVGGESRDPRLERLASNGGPAMLWPTRHAAGRLVEARLLGNGDHPSIRVFGRLLPDDVVTRVLNVGKWRRARDIVGPDRQSLGAIWCADDGSVFFPFDPDEVIRNYWSECYSTISAGARWRPLQDGARRVYYRARPLMPRHAQIWLRRRFASIQARTTFPAWPAETALADFFEFLFGIVSGIAGVPIPRIATWPYGYSWALVLTHDVEQSEGYAALPAILELERDHGVSSCCYFVPRRYAVDIHHLRSLQAEGFEVGVHGLYHDGRDVSSPGVFKKRLPAIREAAENWGATGFRSPALHRHWELMPLLGFDYDTSYPDTDRYEPMPGGCCSWSPFFIDDLVELPVTLPQDHTLFVILRHRDETVWMEKAELLKARGGMALIDSHPDYLVDPIILGAYQRFVERFAQDALAWRALPRDVSAWWRRRAASRLERNGDTWKITGPAAADGRIEFVGGEERRWVR